MIVRSVVVLPAPFRPTRQTTSPAPDLEPNPRRMWLAWMWTSSPATRSIAGGPTRPGGRRPGQTSTTSAPPDARRRRVGEDPALVERDDAVGVAEDDVHVVLDLDDGLAARPRGARRPASP